MSNGQRNIKQKSTILAIILVIYIYVPYFANILENTFKISSLYEYIMNNSKKVIYMRIRELAAEAHVSTTTILRFCKKLNCDGFSEFKLKFKMYIEENNIEVLGDFYEIYIITRVGSDGSEKSLGKIQILIK